MARIVLSLLVVAAVSLPVTVALKPSEYGPGEFGSLTLCPAGGRAFMMAWSLACEMRRKKRSAPLMPEPAKRSQNGYRPATLTEIQKICCDVGYLGSRDDWRRGECVEMRAARPALLLRPFRALELLNLSDHQQSNTLTFLDKPERYIMSRKFDLHHAAYVRLHMRMSIYRESNKDWSGLRISGLNGITRQ